MEAISLTKIIIPLHTSAIVLCSTNNIMYVSIYNFNLCFEVVRVHKTDLPSYSLMLNL